MNSGIIGSKILKKYLTNRSVAFERFKIFSCLIREQSNPKITPDKSAQSFEIIGLSENENNGIACTVRLATSCTDDIKPAFMQKFPSRYEISVFKKLEQQISGIISSRNFADPSTPMRHSDDDTSEKITNGIVKIIHSLMAGLTLQKNDFTQIGKKFPNNIANKNANKKTNGITNFFISSSIR
jgi:hypothetical protein